MEQARIFAMQNLVDLVRTEVLVLYETRLFTALIEWSWADII